MACFKGGAREGQRAAQFLKQRAKEKKEIDFQKRKLETEMKVGEMSTKFVVHYDAIEHQLRTNTIGLVTLDEMKARQKAYMAEREKQLALGANNGLFKGMHAGGEKKNKLQPNEEENNPEDDLMDDNEQSTEDTKDTFEPVKRKRLGKNPMVDTSFLPDIERDEQEKLLREELRQEWVDKQTAIKDEEISITYSYWDGGGHRKVVIVKKGHSIHLFLHRCLEQLRKDFIELKSVGADQMMYIKEDLIIPHHYSFYDFIVTKARGKSGPLFCFDVHDDVRLRSDANVEKEESHAGKVCLRSWYERNKHIFPASRWEPYDPAKNWDQYTISDKMSVKITVK